MGGGSEGGSAASNSTSCAGHASILWSGEVENVWLTSLLFSCLVLVTLTWEYLTERLQHVLEEHGAYKELLEKVYRELTLLGLLSFGLFIKTDTSAAHMDPRLLHAFEFAHYLIFFMAMIFVLFTLVSMRGCLASKRQWDRAAAGSVHAVCDAYIRRLQQGRTSCWSRLLRAVGLYEMQLSFSSEQQAIEWFILRVMFLREYGVSIHFDFSKYARKSLTNAIMRGVRITPATWAFMLCCLLLFAGADLVQRVDRSWEGTEAAEEASNPAVHVVVVGIVSWVALLLQLLLVLLLRQRQRLLLQRKLHILNYSEDLIPHLKENVQLMQMEAQEAESLGHDHLPARRESIDGDSSPRTGGLRLNFEGQTYSVSLQQRVLWLAHCTSMWSCFALAYYCMGLVVIIQRTGWSTVQQVVAHGALLLPHAILALRTSPALMKHEALLSCVVRRSDDIVATVASQMERYDDLRETLRCKLVDAHRQHQELLEDEPSTPTSAALLRLRLQASKTPEVQAMEFTALDVERAAGWLFQKIHGGDTDASSTGKLSVRKFRIGLHWINAYFMDSEWKALCRLLDPGHTLAIQLTDVLSVLRCGREHGSADGFARTGGTGSEEDLESGGATPGGARVISPDQWMYEDVSSLDTEIEAIAAVPLFASVAKSSTTFLKELRMELERRHVPVGEVIVRKGNEGDEMYFVTRGAVEVLLSLDSEPIKTLKSGSTFGETTLLSSDKRNAYIRASEGLVDASIAASGEPFVELYVLSQKGLQKTLDHYPEIRTALEMDVQRHNEQLEQVAGQERAPEPEPEPELERTIPEEP